MRHLITRHLMLGSMLTAATVAFQAPDTATEPATETTAPSSTEITIQGLGFEVDLPYSAGEHVLTAGEANALNQTRAENLRNNFAPKVKAAMKAYREANGLAEDAEFPITELDHDALTADFQAYAAEYEFSMRAGGGSRTPVDPVGKEAHRIAWDKIKVALTKQGIKIDSVGKEKKDELIKATLAKYPAITEEAQRRVNSAADIALDSLEA